MRTEVEVRHPHMRLSGYAIKSAEGEARHPPFGNPQSAIRNRLILSLNTTALRVA